MLARGAEREGSEARETDEISISRAASSSSSRGREPSLKLFSLASKWPPRTLVSSAGTGIDIANKAQSYSSWRGCRAARVIRDDTMADGKRGSSAVVARAVTIKGEKNAKGNGRENERWTTERIHERNALLRDPVSPDVNFYRCLCRRRRQTRPRFSFDNLSGSRGIRLTVCRIIRTQRCDKNVCTVAKLKTAFLSEISLSLSSILNISK